MNRFRFCLNLFPFFVLAMLLPSLALAQFRSSIEGSVMDPSGAFVPGAEVTLTNVDTGISRSVPTNAEGLFRFPALPPGRYKLTVAKAGFATTSQANIELLAEEIRTVSLALKPGDVTETVTVTAESAPIQLSEAKIQSDISAREISQLPLGGRNIGNLILQTPGVTGTGNASGNANDTDIFSLVNNPQANGGGQRGDGNSFYVDNTLATSNPDPGVFNLTPNPDSIQELHVSVNDYSAEYGRSGSLVIQAISKTGTNEFHGSLFEYHQDNKLYARNALSGGAAVPVFRRNEFGGSVGGPILKDKLFGFFSWDQKKSSSPVVFQDTVETPDLVNYVKAKFPNNLSTQLLTKYPATVNGVVPGTIQTVQNLDPNCSTQAPLPGISCNMPVFETTTESFAGTDNGKQWNSRVDATFGKDRFYGNFYRKTHNTQGINTRPAFAAPDSFAGTTNYGNLDWTRTISPTIVNEAAMGVTRISGLGTCNQCQVPVISGMHIAAFGDGFAPAQFIQNDFQWRDLLSVNHGRHAMKFGVDIFRDQDNQLFDGPTQRPGYNFGVNTLSSSPVFGLDPIFDFVQDQPLQEPGINYDLRSGALSQASVGYRTTSYGVFGQDDWKLKPNFSLNLGLRWDFNTSPKEEAGRTSSIILGSGSTFMQRIAGASVGLVPSVTPNHGVADFAPRLSFAWDPTNKGKLSIRGGMGVFYNRAPNVYWTDIRTNPPFVGNVTADASIPTAPQPVYGLCANAATPFNCPIPPASQLPTGLNARGGALNNASGFVGIDPALKQAYSVTRFLGAQYAFTPNWVVEADYSGSQSSHLYVRTERNRCVGCFNPDTGSVNGFRPNPFFTGISYGDNSGWAHYNGATFSVLHRFSRSFSFQAAYTISSTVSTVDAPGLGRDSSLSVVYNPYDINGQRGPASFDIPRAFTAHGIWELPKLTNQNHALRAVLGGWQWSGTMSLQAGYPFTVVDCTHSPTGNGGSCLIPDVAPSVKGRTCSRVTWENGGCFSASEFTLPCPVAQAASGSNPNPNRFVLNCGAGPWEGNAGRNSFRGPGYANVDFSTSKYFHIPWFVGKEGAQLKILGEFFNLFNRTNLNGVANNNNLAFQSNVAIAQGSSAISTNGNFGRPSGAFNPRQIELGLRIEF
jgi:outer membrane receptor protein involved in Fe transport/opacity protein-like surface antigen